MDYTHHYGNTASLAYQVWL